MIVTSISQIALNALSEVGYPHGWVEVMDDREVLHFSGDSPDCRTVYKALALAAHATGSDDHVTYDEWHDYTDEHDNCTAGVVR